MLELLFPFKAHSDHDKPHVSKKHRKRFDQVRRVRLAASGGLLAFFVLCGVLLFSGSRSASYYSKHHAPHRGFAYRAHLQREHEHHLHGSERDQHVHSGALARSRSNGGVLERARSFLSRSAPIDHYGNDMLEPVWSGPGDSLFFDQPPETSPEPYFCPCCGWQGQEFSAYNGRAKAGCPVCGVSERHRFACYLLQTELQDSIKLASDTEPQRFLHFNPTEQIVRRLDRVPNLDQILVDYRADIPGMLHIDLENFQLPTTFLDGIMLVHVLEHAQDDARALEEVSRVLKPDGWMIVEVPCQSSIEETVVCAGDVSGEERAEACGHENHFRRYSCSAFRQQLQDHGFDCHLPRMTQDDLARLTSHIIPKQFVCWRAVEEEEGVEMEGANMIEEFGGQEAVFDD